MFFIKFLSCDRLAAVDGVKVKTKDLLNENFPSTIKDNCFA